MGEVCELRGGLLLGRGSGVYKVIHRRPRRCKCRRSAVSGNCLTHVHCTTYPSVSVGMDKEGFLATLAEFQTSVALRLASLFVISGQLF